MNEWEWLASYGIQGMTTGVVLITVYFVKNYLQTRADRVRYAGMLLVELKAIYTATSPFTSYRSLKNWRGPLPTNVYDGLVSSTELSKFNATLQARLHDLYRDVTNYEIDALGDAVYYMYQDVRDFRRHNEWRRLNRVKIELGLILDPRRGIYAPNEYKMPGMWWLWFFTVPIASGLVVWLAYEVVIEIQYVVATPLLVVYITSWWLLFIAFASLVNEMWNRIKTRDAKLARQLRAMFLYATTIASVASYVVLFAGFT